MRKILVLVILVGSLVMGGEVRAGLTAQQIVDKAMKHSYLGKDGSQASVRMTLKNRRGAQRIRSLLIWSVRKSKRTRSLVRITAPADVRGTSFLFKENASGSDDMWLYIPALKRTRRIVGKAFKHVALKLDVSYQPDRGFIRTDPVAGPFGNDVLNLRVEHHTLMSAVSVEYAWGSKLVAQLQGVHLALLDRRPSDSRELMGFLRQAHAALLVALVRLSLLRQTLLITAAAAVDLIHGSFTLAPMVHYKITDHWRVGVGALVFEGRSDTLFGAWTQNDLLWLDARWSF